MFSLNSMHSTQYLINPNYIHLHCYWLVHSPNAQCAISIWKTYEHSIIVFVCVILCIILYLCTHPTKWWNIECKTTYLEPRMRSCSLLTWSPSVQIRVSLIIFTKTFFFSAKHQKTRCYLWVLKTFISNINFPRENREPCLRSRARQLLLCSLILSRISLLVNVR